MSIAVVFDSAGTLLHTYRVAKDVEHQEILPGIETVTLTFTSPDRVLAVIHVHSREVIEASPSQLLSSYLVEKHAGFGISCTRKVMTADDIGDVL
ncbi:MAG: haloacid dehalogenase, partial [Methanoregulaceae archaeon]|nr:haloacid dehalogenase [Methanoregulaceae archaeon]